MSEQTPQDPSRLDTLYPQASGPAPGASAPAPQPAPPQPPQGPVPPPPAAPPPPASPYYGYYTPPPVPPRRRHGLLTGLIVIVVCLVGFGLIGALISWSTGGVSVGDKIGVVSVNGIIHSETISSPFFGTEGGANVTIDQLRQAEKDDSVKVVILRINSPGGSPAAAQAIYKAVLRLQQRKPVVASMADVAASGGYYVAAGAGTIVAAPTTMTGSIGVIMQGLNYAGLMNKYGVQDQAITTGPYKDTGSAQRPMRPDERALLKAMLLDTYDQFVTDVAAGRKLDVAYVKKLADGRVYTGRQAQHYKLVDELGDFYDATKIAQKKANLTGEAQFKYFRKGSFLSNILESAVGRVPQATLAQQAFMQQALREQQLGPVMPLLMMPGYGQMQVW